MNELQLFSFEEQEVRVIKKGEDVWFVASDVSNILGYSQTQAMLKRLDNDEMLKIEPSILDDTNSMARLVTIINESGLYNAILGSKMPNAKQFKKWVTSEVLPSIRKHE